MGKFNYFYQKEKRLDKFSQYEQETLIFDLINAFALTKTSTNSALLLQDLLTEKEVRNLAKRLAIAKLLIAGKKNEEIVVGLHCSFATVSKVRLWLDNAGDGLRAIIKQLPKRRKVFRPKLIPGIGYGLPQILLSYTTEKMESKESSKLKRLSEKLRRKTHDDRDFKENLTQEFRRKK